MKGMSLASIFGGASIYWGILWGKTGSKMKAARNCKPKPFRLRRTKVGPKVSLPWQSSLENSRHVVTVLPSLRIAKDKFKDKTKRPFFQVTKCLPDAYRAGEIQAIRYENTVITLLTVRMFCPKIKREKWDGLEKGLNKRKAEIIAVGPISPKADMQKGSG